MADKAKPLERGIIVDPSMQSGTRELSDAEQREIVPTRADVPTKYHPSNDLMMIVPLPNVTKVGNIILPDKVQIVLNEGHVVEKGPKSGDQFEIGDCVTWDQQSEYRLDIDGVKFVLVRPNAIIMRIPVADLGQQAKP